MIITKMIFSRTNALLLLCLKCPRSRFVNSVVYLRRVGENGNKVKQLGDRPQMVGQTRCHSRRAGYHSTSRNSAKGAAVWKNAACGAPNGHSSSAKSGECVRHKPHEARAVAQLEAV